MPELLSLVQFVAGVLGVVAGLFAAADLVVSLRRGDGASAATTSAIGALSLAAIVVGAAVLATVATGRQADGTVLASLAVVLGALAAIHQRTSGSALTR